MPQSECDSKSAAVNKLCLALQSEDKRVRKQALLDFENYLRNGDFTTDDYHALFKETHIHLLNTLRDKSEPVREQSIKFFKLYIIDILPINDYYLSYLFPLFIERIGSVEIIEESEEIRLHLVLLLQAIISKYGSDNRLKPFLNDFIVILKETVQDKYPAIKENSCKCIVSLAIALKRDFHTGAASLVKPILTAFAHQRFKIRIEAIKCIGEVVLHCDYKALDDAVGPMAERLFDQIPAVRQTVAQVAARWLLEYRDRYSFFHKLLPLILTGLNDEVLETRQEAHELWLAVGMQYQKENEKDLKDQLDYLTAPPKYYPENLPRPNLGCRTVVQRTVSKLSGALARELGSWQADVRVRCSQLLCSVAHHAEAGLTQHMQDLLMAMYSAARDEDVRVVMNIVRASEIMAVFVPVETWMELVIPVLEDGPHFGHLMVLAALIRGAPQEFIASSIREICQLLATPDICYSRKPKYQCELVKCVIAAQSKYTTELSEDVGQYIFNILLTVLSIKDPDNVDVDFHLLDALRSTLELDTDHAMWAKFVPKLLDSIKKDPKAWTEITIERCIFETIVLKSGESFGENLAVVGDILVEALDVDVEAESRLKTFCALSTALENKDVIFKRAQELQSFLEKIVTDVLVPSLVWHAGRVAEAMRTMAASCLCSALSPGTDIHLFADKNLLRSVFNRLLPLLLSLIEDASYRSRHLAMENLVLLKQNLVRNDDWQADDLIKIYPEVLKRLDDPTEQVRVCAIRALSLLLKESPQEFTNIVYKSHYELLLDTLLTHFDDDDAKFQELVADVLKTMAAVSPSITRDKVSVHKPLIRNQVGCERIIKYMDELRL